MLRRLLITLLVPVLLLGAAAPAFGAGYRETALSYLTERFEVSADQIELYEGGLVELEFTRVSMWVARYIISDGSGSGAATGGREPATSGSTTDGHTPTTDRATAPAEPKGELTPLPAPRILPAPPDKGDGGSWSDGGFVYGAVYISTATGRVLEPAEAEALFAAEQEIAVREWERLSREAGKVDVSLYRRLLAAAATDVFPVWIVPVPVIDDEVRAAFEELKAAYPRIAADRGVTLEGVLFPQHAETLPFPMPFLGAADTPVAVTDPAPPTIGSTRPAPTTDKPGGGTEPAVREPALDDEYWRESAAFWEGVEEIRAMAVAGSLEELGAALDEMGVAYENQQTGLSAEMTSAQINAIAGSPHVAAIWENAVHTMDASSGYDTWRGIEQTTSAPAPGFGARTAAAASELAETAAKAAPAVLLGMAIVCGGAVMLQRRRRQ